MSTAGTLEVTEQQAALLALPWPEHLYGIRDDGEVYVPWQCYAERLTRCFGPFAWALVPLEKPTLKGNEVFVHYALMIDGGFVAEAVESHAYYASNRKTSYDDAIESAKSECLRRLCKGRVGTLDAWDRSWREAWKAANAVQVWRKGQYGDRGKFAWRKITDPPFPDEGHPDKSPESEYSRKRDFADEAKDHMDSIQRGE